MRDITPSGHADSIWRPTIDALPRSSPRRLRETLTPAVRRPRVLVVSAHPDDETLGGGRLLADWAMADVDVLAVVATAGEACFDAANHVEPGLAATRIKEWHAALEILGAQPIGCLNLPDGDLQDHPLTAALTELISTHRPDIIAGTHAADPHPDHQAVGRAVAHVAAAHDLPAVGWPVWLTYFADPPGPEGLQVITCSAEAEQARSRAWESFTSQRLSITSGIAPVVPEAMTALLCEQLLEVAHLPSTARPNTT